MVAAVACLGSGEAEAQYRRRYIARDLRAEAQLAAYIAQLNALTAQERARQAAAARSAAGRQRALPPGVIPVNVPVNIPMYGPLTPGQRNVINMTTIQTVGAANAACLARQASQPYDRFGRLNDGWYATQTGPRLRSCYY